MQQFSSALGTGNDWREASEDCFAKIPSATTANVGFIYVTDVIAGHLSEVVDFARLKTGISHWVGTVGMGICTGRQEVYDRPGVSSLLAEFPPESYHLFEVNDVDLGGLDGPCANWMRVTHPYFGVVHGDPSNPNIVSLVENLSERMQSGFLVGGLTCSRGPGAQAAGHITTGGLSGILFDPQVAVSTRITQGCRPLAKARVVTRVESNLVYELDGKPAFDLLREDLGDATLEQVAQMGGYLFVGLPIRGSDTGDYLVRNLVGIDPDSKALAIGDYVNEGERLMFCRRDRLSAVEDLRRMLLDLKKALPGPPRAGVYYTCIGRGQNLFETESEELTTIGDVLGDFPITGFYANGEICNNRLYAYTGVLTIFH